VAAHLSELSMTQNAYNNLTRLAARRLAAMRSARSAQYRAQISREPHARGHCEAVAREQAQVARMYSRRLVAGVRAWNAQAEQAYSERGVIVVRLSASHVRRWGVQ
jgi:hypothetical protein